MQLHPPTSSAGFEFQSFAAVIRSIENSSSRANKATAYRESIKRSRKVSTGRDSRSARNSHEGHRTEINPIEVMGLVFNIINFVQGLGSGSECGGGGGGG